MKKLTCMILLCMLLLCTYGCANGYVPDSDDTTETEEPAGITDAGTETETETESEISTETTTESVADTAQPEGQCPYCGNLEGERRWFIAEIVNQYSIIPVGTECFEAVAAMGAVIHVNVSSTSSGEPLVEGDFVRITYNGMIMESYPVQIKADLIEKVGEQGDYPSHKDTLYRPDTKLEFWIADNVDDVDFSAYQEKYGMFGGRQYYGTGYVPTLDESGQQVDPEHCVIYTVTSYPDYSDKEQHVTGIYITDPTIWVYGVTLKMSLEEFSNMMRITGFEITDLNEYSATAKKGKYSITMTKEYIMIRVEVENKEGIVF